MPVPVIDSITSQKVFHCQLHRGYRRWLTLPIQDSISDVTGVSIQEFLRRMDVVLSKYERDIELEAKVKEVMHTWPFEHQIRPHVITGLIIAETGYIHVSNVEARVAIAIYTALFTAIDDPDVFDSIGAQDFWRRICDGSILQDEGIMGKLAQTILSMGRFYNNVASGTILASSLRWFNGEMISNQKGHAFVEPHSKTFVDFSRSLSGDAETYAALIWSQADFPDEYTFIETFPDACVFINHTNDILSFYKEEQDGEVTTYIHARARVTGKSLSTTLNEVIDEAVAAALRVRRTLGDGKAREAWDSFERGYISFHAGDPRYRLRDVLGAHWEYMTNA